MERWQTSLAGYIVYVPPGILAIRDLYFDILVIAELILVENDCMTNLQDGKLPGVTFAAVLRLDRTNLTQPEAVQETELHAAVLYTRTRLIAVCPIIILKVSRHIGAGVH